MYCVHHVYSMVISVIAASPSNYHCKWQNHCKVNISTVIIYSTFMRTALFQRAGNALDGKKILFTVLIIEQQFPTQTYLAFELANHNISSPI